MAAEWRAGDVVRLDDGEVVGRCALDVVNPWVLLNDTDENGDQLYYQDGYIQAHSPVLLVRDGQRVSCPPELTEPTNQPTREVIDGQAITGRVLRQGG